MILPDTTKVHHQIIIIIIIIIIDMDISYTRVLHPKVAHPPSHSHSQSQMTSRLLRHTAAAMRAHNVLQGTVEQLRWTVAAFLVYVLRCCT
jgi:dolichol kinase